MIDYFENNDKQSLKGFRCSLLKRLSYDQVMVRGEIYAYYVLTLWRQNNHDRWADLTSAILGCVIKYGYGQCDSVCTSNNNMINKPYRSM